MNNFIIIAKHIPIHSKSVERISFVYLLDELNNLKIVSQLIFLYVLIFDVEIEQNKTKHTQIHHYTHHFSGPRGNKTNKK